MRLLFVIDHFGSGGAQRQMVSLALALQKRGHQVEFFIYYSQYNHFKPILENAGIFIHRFEKKSRFSFLVIFALRRLIQHSQYDAILSYLQTPSFYAEFSNLGIRTPPLIVSERSTLAANHFPWRVWLMLQCHRIADHIVVNSHYQCERLQQLFPWIVPKISPIVNGVDLQEFSPVLPTEVTSPKSGRLELLAVGRIGPEKNAAGLVKAMALCRERYGYTPIIRWAGHRDQSEIGEKSYHDLMTLMDAMKIHDSWEWLGQRADIPKLLHQHDALIHPSFYEGFPNAVCEALAAGRPVLVSNVCDHPRLIQPDVNGYLFDPTNPQDIATAITRFAALSLQEKKEMGHRARCFAERQLSMEYCVDRYEALFMRLTQPTRIR